MEQQKQPTESRFALLIDADNVSSKYIKPIMDELSKYGTVTYKRIYGDWTNTLHAKWKDTLLDNSLTPIQQFSYTAGKNATDSAMIIDAMDILYTKSVEGFCIVSSDSDFTRLASRIRESGLTVIGMGEKKTPTAFRKACDIFTTLELLVRADRDKANGGHTTPKAEIEQAVVTIITDNQNNGKSTGLGEVGSRLLKQYPDFDVRSYGTNLLSKLLGEFKSVDVIRDGSNVAVVLSDAGADAKGAATDESASASEAQPLSDADAPEQTTDPAAEETPGGSIATDRDAEPKRTRRRRKSKVINGEPIKTEDVKADESHSGNTASETASGIVPAPNDASAPEGADDTTAEARFIAAVPTSGEPAQKAAQNGCEASPALQDEKKPSRTRRGSRGGRSRGRARKIADAAQEIADAPATSAETTVEASAANAAPDDAEKIKANATNVAEIENAADTANAASFVETEAAANATQTAPILKRRRGRPSRKAEPSHDDLNATVAVYVRDVVRATGSQGVDINDLVNSVRANFKAFKVRDLGYKQFKSYVADLDDIVVEKQGKTTVARLAD